MIFFVLKFFIPFVCNKKNLPFTAQSKPVFEKKLQKRNFAIVKN